MAPLALRATVIVHEGTVPMACPTASVATAFAIIQVRGMNGAAMTIVIMLIAWDLVLAIFRYDRLQTARAGTRATTCPMGTGEPGAGRLLQRPWLFHCASETDTAPSHATGRKRAGPIQPDCEDWQSGNASDDTSYRQSHISPGYAEYYEKTYAEGYYAIQWEQVEKPLVRKILAGLAAQGTTRSLDFACGTGRILQLHGDLFDDVVGVDISAEMLAVARQRCPEARIVQADLTVTGVTGGVAERQVCTAFRFFLNAEPALRADVLDVLTSCLVEGGHLVANFHCNPASPIGTFYRLRNRLAGRTINNVMSVGEAEALLRAHGFAIEAVYRYGLWPRFGWWFNRLNELLLAPAETLGRRVPILMRSAQSFVIVARRG